MSHTEMRRAARRRRRNRSLEEEARPQAQAQEAAPRQTPSLARSARPPLELGLPGVHPAHSHAEAPALPVAGVTPAGAKRPPQSAEAAAPGAPEADSAESRAARSQPPAAPPEPAVHEQARQQSAGQAAAALRSVPPAGPAAADSAARLLGGPPALSLPGRGGAPSTHVQVPALQGGGEPRRRSAYAGSVRLEGRTDATFDGGRYTTTGVSARPASGCEGCGDCVRVTGTLVATYSVATTVNLPSANDFPNLTPCQRRRVQQAITTVLAPHEQEHVKAFNRYNGVTRRTFDLTLCRTAFDSAIDAMFQAEEAARRAAAQAASDALDPFHFNVDLDCEEPPARRTSAGATAENPPEA